MEAKQLRELRLHLGLTQTEMAEKLGITRDGVAKMEAGDCNMSKSVDMLAQQLAITRSS